MSNSLVWYFESWGVLGGGAFPGRLSGPPDSPCFSTDPPLPPLDDPAVQLHSDMSNIVKMAMQYGQLGMGNFACMELIARQL